MTKKNNSKNSAGTTLIEILIYIALFSIVMAGGTVGAYQVIQSSNRTSDKNILEQDANFILRKMDWALTGATLLVIPNPQKLVVTTSSSSVTFTLSGADFQKDGAPLNSSRIKISNLSFAAPSATGKPGVTMKFTAKTFDDKLSQTFSMTKYLR